MRSLGRSESMHMFVDACCSMDQLLLAGLGRDFPEAQDEELQLRAAVLEYGADLMGTLTGRRLDGT